MTPSFPAPAETGLRPNLRFWLLISLAVALRLAMVPNRSGDFTYFLSPWYDYIQANGGFAALRTGFSDYTPPYLYWLAIAATWGAALPKLLAIKLFGMATDFVLAFYVYRILRLPGFSAEVRARAHIGFWAVLFLPTVMLNSALWGQCDGIYTTAVVACVYHLIRSQPLRACLFFGLAFAFKLQTVFLGPLLLIALLPRHGRPVGALLIPLPYLLLILPNWALGRPVSELLLIYANQAAQYPRLSSNAANLYEFIPDTYYWPVLPLGVAFTALVVLAVVWRVARRGLALSATDWITLAFFFALFVPYALPKMHERYFYMAEVFCLIHAVIHPRDRIWIAVLQIGTLLGYLGGDVAPLIRYGGIANGVVLVLLVQRYLLPLLRAPRATAPQSG